jgi:hypothetical protein
MNEDLELLIEATAGAWRVRDPNGRPIPPPAWWDLPADAREHAFELQQLTREWERAIDSDGFSGTVRAVLEKLSAF